MLSQDAPIEKREATFLDSEYLPAKRESPIYITLGEVKGE
jgi:hypothetical protein